MKFTRWDDIDLSIRFTNQDDWSPLDITWATVYFTVKKTWSDWDDDSDALIQKDQTIHTDALDWKTTISLSHTDTNVPSWLYEYDFQVKDSYGYIMSTISDKVTIEKDITRRW